MAVKTEGLYLGDVLKYEAEALYCREPVTVLAGAGADRVLTTAMVLGRITKGAATGAAVAGNTGNGTITAAPTVGQAAKPGVYRITCIEPATNGGTFVVEDPDGIVIGTAVVGTAFTTHLTFTISDGAVDFVAGDAFTITVAAGSGKVKQIDFAAADGADKAYGILVADVTAPNGVDAKGTAIVNGPAVVATNGLVWPAGATQAQKDAAIAQLKAVNIKTREGA
jgi:hypothetical protein